MESTAPGNTNTSSNYPQAPAPDPMSPKRRWPFSRKLTIIIGAAIVAMLLIAAVVIMLNKGLSGDKEDSQDKSSLYIKQSGYEKAGDGIGDALALISKPGDHPIQYGGMNVIQACSVLTIKDIRDTGLKIFANQLPGAVRRVFFDGQSPAQLPKPRDNFLPFDDDSNYCQYYLDNHGTVEVTVFQPTYASKSAVDYELSKNYVASSTVDNIKVYEKKPGEKPDISTYILRGSNFDAMLYLSTPNKEAKTSLLNTLAKHLNENAGGTPNQIFSYQSPILTGGTADPCMLFGNDDFKKIFGIDSSPLVEESLGTAVGVIQSSVTQKFYNYVSHDCKRRSPDGSTRDKTLSLNTETYETIDGAKAIIAFEQNPGGLTKNRQSVSPTVGDESFFADTSGMANALVFRKGRVVIHMSYYLPQGDNAETPEKRIQNLRPLAEAIANDRLKGF